MSFQGTSSPVSALTRSYRTGVLLRWSSMRKWMSLRRSPDISRIGTLSRPNERVPVQMGRAMGRSSNLGEVEDRPMDVHGTPKPLVLRLVHHRQLDGACRSGCVPYLLRRLLVVR